MKFVLIGLAIIATTCAQSVSNEYLPPVEDYSGAGTNAYETNILENEPAHSLSDDGYRYKTVKRYRLRHRRDVNELTHYLPPQAASNLDFAYGDSAQVASYEAESAPEDFYSAPQSIETSYESAASEPAHILADDGYRYKTVKRYRLRHRRDVNELTHYLPPQAASNLDFAYGDSAQVASYEAESAPEDVYSAPQSFDTSYESAASEPAHILADDGYRYKTVKRYRLRHRRDVNELTHYLPPQAASNLDFAYGDSAQVASYEAESAPEDFYSAPQSFETSYESAASEPAHTLGDDGYRYKTVKRYRLRRH